MSPHSNLKKTYVAVAIGYALASQPAIADEINLGVACSLREAILSANSDTAVAGCTPGDGPDVINMIAGTTVTFTQIDPASEGYSGLPVIDSDITIQGNGSTLIRDNAAPNLRLFQMKPNSSLHLNSLTLQNGRYGNGNAIYAMDAYSLSIRNSTVSNNTGGSAVYLINTDSLVVENSTLNYNGQANSGTAGAIDVRQTDVEIINSTITNNSASNSAGVHVYQGDLLVSNGSTISSNSASANVSGIYVYNGGLEVTDTTVSGNISNNNSGIYVRDSASVTIGNSSISDNSATNAIAGVYLNNSIPVNVSISGSNIDRNKANRDTGLKTSYVNLMLTNSTVSGNSSSTRSAGAYVYNGSATVTGSSINGNTAVGSAAGLYITNGTATLSGSQINTNIAGDDRAGFYASDISFASLVDTEVIGNSANDRISGVYLQNAGSVTLNRATISDNSTTMESSAGVAINGTNVPVMITDTTIHNNTAGGSKSGLYLYNSTTSLINSQVTNNSSRRNGSGIYANNGSLSITGGEVSNNYQRAAGSAAILTYGTAVTLSDVLVSSNTSTMNRGAINVYGMSTLNISDSTISNNVLMGGGQGGGIYFKGASFTLANSTITGNSISTGTGSAQGGGMFLGNAVVDIQNSTIANNTVDAPNTSGGGIYFDSGLAYIANSTITGNSAQRGAGLFDASLANLGLTNVTLAANFASNQGGGLYISHAGVMVDISNTIIADNENGDCGAPLPGGFSGTNNWFGDVSCTGVGQGDPRLGRLSDNTGPTLTMFLRSNSGAIDAGDPTVCAAQPILNKDQRGLDRDAICDIGAYEFGINDPVEGVFFVVPAPNGNTLTFEL